MKTHACWFLVGVFLYPATGLGIGAFGEEAVVDLARSQSGGMPTALASAPNINFSAAKACDDRPDTGWVSEKDAFPVWIRVEWRVPVEIREVTFKHFPKCPFKEAGPAGKYRVEILDDGKWVQVAAGDASRTPLETEVGHRLHQPTETTGVRLLIESAPTGQVGIAELRVMGPEVVLPIEWAPRWQARWIWPEPSLYVPHREPVRRYFRRSFDIEDPSQIREAWLLGCGFDRLNRIWVNNHSALTDITYHGGSLREAKVARIPVDWLLEGENVLAASVDDIYESGSHGLLAEFLLVGNDGGRTIIATDKEWLGQEDQGIVPDWRKPGLSDKRWVPCTEQTWPNTRWHWPWNVLRPTVAPTDRLTVLSVDVHPQPAKPGEPVTVKIVFEISKTPTRDFAVVLRLGQTSFWRNHDFRLGGAFLRPEEVSTSRWQPGRHEVEFQVPIPEHAPAETPATLFVSTQEESAGLEAAFPDATADPYGVHFVVPVDRGQKTSPKEAGFPRCEVRTVGGNPTLHLDGKPVSPIIWSSSYGNYRRYAEHAKTGVKLFRPIIQGTPIPAPGEEEAFYAWWFAQIDRMLSAAVAVAPEARLLPAIWMDPNPQWLFNAPSEQMIGGRGQLVIPLSHSVPDRGQVRPTFMSQAWRRDGSEGLKRLVEHLSSQPYSRNLIGLCFMAGRAGENYWGGNEYNVFINDRGRYDCKPRDQWQAGDFSMAARRTFREFLIGKYGTNENLQNAWRRDAVDFDDILEPARFRREEVCNILTWANKPENTGSLRDPSEPGVGTLPMDYFQCMAEAMIDTFAAWGKAVKEASDGRLITGCYYGYAISQLYTSVPGFHAHTAVARACRTPDLDFFVSPSEYNAARRAGGPYWGLNIVDSLRLHNKLWIHEQDTRTYLAEHMPKTFSRRETIEVLKRDAAAALTRGAGWWYYEFAQGQGGPLAREWFVDPEIAGFARHIKKICDHSLTLPDRGPSAEIAVFYHGRSLTAQDLFSPTAQLNITIGRLTLVNGMQRIGAPFDLYNLADIPVLEEKGLLKQYKMCLFLNPFYVTDEERRWLELCKGGGRTLVWLWAPGAASAGKSPSPENVIEVTGIPGVKWLDRKAPQIYRVSSEDHPLLGGLPREENFAAVPFPPGGTWAQFGNEVWPLVYVDSKDTDIETKVLGHWVIDGRVRHDMAAICLRTVAGGQNSWHSVYATVPYLSPQLMRNIARFAGVHLYRDSDEVLFASRHFVAIHTGAELATGELYLPNATPVYDVFSHKVVSTDAKTVHLNVAPYSTKLFYLGDPTKFQKAVEHD